MVSDSSSEPLPPLYQKWIAELLGGSIPRESRATCDHCAMGPGDPSHAPGQQTYFFDPNVKCCTYIPTLPNFLVGRILDDTDPAAQPGRSTVEKRATQGIGVLPLGLRPPAVFTLLYGNSTQSFGRAHSLKCPHYLEDGGRCGVWHNRNSICSTWFCKHVRGHVGFTFWRRSLLPLLETIERALARWCVLELQFSDETLRHLLSTPEWNGETGSVTGDQLDNRLDRKAYAQIWGDWLGREHEFFRRCGEIVSVLPWAEVLKLGGPEAAAYARLTRKAYQKMLSETLPSVLEVGSFQLVQIQTGVTRVNSYSDYDPLDVPQSVMELLGYFDGSPTDHALKAIAEELGIQLDPALVRKLVDFKILVPGS